MSKTQSKFGVTIPKIPELINVTYTEITALIGSNTLVPGQKYLITDYQTVHTIPTTVDTNTGPIEPLIVTALSVNELEPIAYSTLHPEDIIYYDVENNLTRVPGCTKGHILRRIDTLQNNDIPTDWRYVKYRRYALNVTNTYDVGTSYARGAVVIDGVGDTIYVSMVSSNIGNALSDKTKWLTSVAIINGEYLANIPSNFNIGVGTIPVNSLDYNDYTMFESDTILRNNVFNSSTDFLLTINTVFRNYLDAIPIYCQSNYNVQLSGGINIVKQFVGISDISIGGSLLVDIQGMKGGSIANSVILKAQFLILNGPNIQSSLIENEMKNCIFNGVLFLSIINSTPDINDDFQNNIINFPLRELSIIGGMKNNIINTQILTPGLNLTEATHIYANYTKNWFRSSTGVNKLQYIDGADITQTALITA